MERATECTCPTRMFPVKFAEQTGEENLIPTGTRNSSETTESNKSSGTNDERIPAGIMNVGELKASLKIGRLLLVVLEYALFPVISW